MKDKIPRGIETKLIISRHINRPLEAFAMRQEGTSYKKISCALGGISSTRVSQLIKKGRSIALCQIEGFKLND